MCDSPELTVLVTNTGPASVYLITITAVMAAWIAACITSLDSFWLCHFSLNYYYFSASTGMNVSAFLRLLLLTSCNVISLKCNNTDVVAYTTLLTMYSNVCVMFKHAHIKAQHYVICLNTYKLRCRIMHQWTAQWTLYTITWPIMN